MDTDRFLGDYAFAFAFPFTLSFSRMRARVRAIPFREHAKPFQDPAKPFRVGGPSQKDFFLKKIKKQRPDLKIDPSGLRQDPCEFWV